jgi:3-oxoacyl-[acyl-carrier protein] reductase
LEGKVAVVTGGSRGIGAAIARRLAADGAKVVVCYARSPEAANVVVRQIKTAGGHATALHADLSDPDQVEPLFDGAQHAYGRVDILVNNAGAFEPRHLDDVDSGHYARLFDLNVRGPLLATVEAARRFGPEGGRVINISAKLARAVHPGATVYSASKAALEAMTRCHAHELGPRKVTVNAVAPGPTESDMLRAGLPDEARVPLVQKTALGRIGEPEDIADVVAFLASDDARWITGQVIDATGGLQN